MPRKQHKLVECKINFQIFFFNIDTSLKNKAQQTFIKSPTKRNMKSRTSKATSEELQFEK